MSKIKLFTGGHVSETEQKATVIMKEGCASQKEASLIPSSVGKALVFLTESYGWKVALRKVNSVFSEIKKENQKSRSILS